MASVTSLSPNWGVTVLHKFTYPSKGSQKSDLRLSHFFGDGLMEGQFEGDLDNKHGHISLSSVPKGQLPPYMLNYGDLNGCG